MKAMILAAGRGKRLRPLTDELPKPLIKVAGKSLIEYHLLNLAKAGYKDIIINTAWLAEKIHRQLGNGENYGVSIQYSNEEEALETAGGIIKALPLLGNEPFLVVNGDIWCDLDFSTLPTDLTTQAHLVLVNNPEHNINGDFSIHESLLQNTGETMYTFSGIGIYNADFFSNQPLSVTPLAPLIRSKCNENLVSAQHYDGLWTDVGTTNRLQKLETQLNNN